jgi:hypothetical protein
MNTNYFDSICIAAQNAYQSDLPIDLMPLTITMDASLHAGLDSDQMGCADWH